MNGPFFSIIIPCYNQAHFLGECVRSVIEQSFTDWEVIIVNDGSADNTLEVAQQLANEESRVKVVSKENGGLSSARNAGITVSAGKYLQFLDADDFILENSLDLINSAISDFEADLIRVGYVYVDEANRRFLNRVVPGKIQGLIPTTLISNLGPCHSIFVRRSMIFNIGLFDESLNSVEDWDFWMRAAKAGATISTISKALVAYRYVSGSMSRDAFRMYDALKTVTLRASRFDKRIRIESKENKDRNLDLSLTMKYQLARCLGVSVMQGKIKESVQLYNQECKEFNLNFSSYDFAPMYSYLSFRYWSTQEEVKLILTEFYPRFVLFFNQIEVTLEIGQQALDIIFLPVFKIANRRKYGYFIGSILNRFFLKRPLLKDGKA